MSATFNIIRLLSLVIFTSLASTVFAASPIFINAESGTARSLDGVWEYGCEIGDPGEPDSNEYLVIVGNKVEGRELSYSSTDGSCSSGEMVTSFDTGTLNGFDDLTTLGWTDDEGNPVPPPLRLDGAGPLASNPTVTRLIISGSQDGVEPGFFYLDDTAGPWCLYNGVGPVDPVTHYPSFVDTAEPRCKVGIQPVFSLACDIELNQDLFVDGETITADVFRVANRSGDPIAMELKIWLGVPDASPVSIANVGAFGGYALPAGTDVDLGPISLGTVTAAWPREDYDFSCRMLDRITGGVLWEDRNFFEVEFGFQ